MTNWLKQSTAVVIPFGPFVDKTDGVTPETGLVSALDHASTGIMLSKNGGAKAVRHATVTATTYDAYGDYRVTLDTTDTNTLGSLRVSFIETATCLPVWRDFMVVPANVWDSMFGADYLQVDATQLLGTNFATPATAGLIDVNVKQVSTDATAADNLEAILDGTRAKLYLSQLSIVAGSNDSAIDVAGAGTGHGIKATGGGTAGTGMKLAGGAGGEGLSATGGSSGASGILAQGGDPDGSGMALLGSLFIQTPGDDPSIVLVNVDETGDLITGNGDPIGGGAGGGGDMTAINGSTTAAENARKAFSGEAYNAAGLSIATAANVTNMVTANLTQVGSSATRAQRLIYLLDGLTYSTAKTGTLTATAFTTNLTETTNDHYVGATIKFVSGALAGQLSFVSDYNGSTKTITVSPALTEAPANGDVFILL